MLEDAVQIADPKRAEDEDRDAHTCAAKDDAFLDIGAGEHCRTGLLEGGPNFSRAVTVRVCFDDGDDLWNRLV